MQQTSRCNESHCQGFTLSGDLFFQFKIAGFDPCPAPLRFLGIEIGRNGNRWEAALRTPLGEVRMFIAKSMVF
jgi:hypothetical protein